MTLNFLLFIGLKNRIKKTLLLIYVNLIFENSLKFDHKYQNVRNLNHNTFSRKIYGTFILA